MKLLITGATGFVGRHLVPLLLHRGHQVHLLVRNPKRLPPSFPPDRVELVRGDLFASETFPQGLQGVIHMAALTKAVRAADLEKINAEGTRSLLERLSEQPSLRTFLCLSSLAAAGPSGESVPHGEDDPADPVSAYGKSKLAQEKIVEAQAPGRILVVRAPIVYGEGDLDLLDALKIIRRNWLLLLGRQQRTFSAIYAGDLATGIARLIEGDAPAGRYYVTHPDPIEWQSFMRMAAEIMGRTPRTLTLPLKVAWLAGVAAEGQRILTRRAAIFSMDKFREMRYPHWVCSGEKMLRATGFVAPTPHRQALEAAIAWYRSEGYL